MATIDERIASVRSFSRAYTRRIGLLQASLLHTPLSLSEGRLVWELAQRGDATAAQLAADLELDPGYVSRLLAALDREGYLSRSPCPDDRRRTWLGLTERGQAAFAEIDAAARREVGALLAALPESAQERLVASLETARALLGDRDAGGPAYILRSPRAGDLGWVVQAHGALYAREYGWDWTFEALVAGIVQRFAEGFDPARERCWIAERAGENVGCVFVVRREEEVAQLRCLLVDPSARGLGLGRRLVQECLRFARDCAYRRMMLWTNDALVAARAIYEKEGFSLVAEEPHHSYGHDLVGQTWERAL